MQHSESCLAPEHELHDCQLLGFPHLPDLPAGSESDRQVPRTGDPTQNSTSPYFLAPLVTK